MKELTLAALLLVCASSSVRPQSLETESWGESVEGVQLRLAIAQLATPQVPLFELRVRNQSNNPVTYVAEAIDTMAEIEIDGIWYGVASAGSCCTAPQTIAPGSQSRAIELRLQSKTMFKLGPGGAPVNTQLWTLMPGRHTVRVRSRSRGRIGITVQGTTPHPIVLLSNAVSFDVISAQAVAGASLLPDMATLALDMAKACVGKSPADFRSIWGSPLDFDRAGVSKGTGPNLVNVFIPEAAPRGKPQGLAVEINTNTGTCLKLNDRLE